MVSARWVYNNQIISRILVLSFIFACWHLCIFAFQAYVQISLHQSTSTGHLWHLFLLRLFYQLGRRLRKKNGKKVSNQSLCHATVFSKIFFITSHHCEHISFLWNHLTRFWGEREEEPARSGYKWSNRRGKYWKYALCGNGSEGASFFKGLSSCSLSFWFMHSHFHSFSSTLLLLKVEVSITITLAQLRLANTFRLSDPGKLLY